MRKKLVISLIIWFVCGFNLLIAIVEISELFLIPLFLLALVLGLWINTMKCPKCGKPVTYNPIKIFGVNIYFWTPWIPKKCSKCGHELN